MSDPIEGALSDALGRPVSIRSRQPLSGGSINRTERVETEAGTFVVKTNPNPLPRLFETEAEGLDALRSSGTPLLVPRPLAHREARGGQPAFIILEYIESGRRQADFDEALGRGLAELHRATAPEFGFTSDNYCGATAQPNRWTSDWITFYREHRLGHQCRLADRAGLLGSSELRSMDRLLARLDDLLASDAKPALIHGDLWSGNLHVGPDGLPAILDPAAYYGHPEAELGMMTLFGGFSGRVFSAYEEAASIASDWRERNPLYQLYHVLNHLNLFGGGYRASAMAIVRRFV